MPRIIKTYASANGTICSSLKEATINDIVAILGNEGLARTVFENRDSLVRILEDYTKLAVKEKDDA